MESVIVGLPYVGKTTFFNLLTGARAATGTFVGADAPPNVGVAKVPDDRLDQVGARFRPKRVVHAEMRYRDVGIAKGSASSEIGARHLGELRNADALANVVRAFRDPAVPHVEGSIDPARDAGSLELELLVADLGVIEHRVERLGPELRSARASEREAKEREARTLERIRASLASGTPVRDLDLDDAERKALRGFGLLSEKPQLVVVNLDEGDLARAEEVEREVRAALEAHRRTSVIALCAKIEAEIADLSPDEAAAFRRELGLAAPPLERVVRETFRLLGLISFFTVNPEEAHAWTTREGTTAVEAAGQVHSDFARGFIRAEVIDWKALLDVGGLAEARAKGILRVEGRDAVVHDGEVLHALFSVARPH